MAEASAETCRLCLVTPVEFEAEAFAPRLDDALAGGDVASLIIQANPDDRAHLPRAAEALVPRAAAHGVAALVHNDIELAGRVGADGVHVDGGIDALNAAIAALRPDRIVGAGGFTTRHTAMLAGEADPDYVFFGRLDGDNRPGIFPRARDLAAWWSSLFVIPAIVMGGSALDSVTEAAEAGAEFVALGSAVWDHPDGPGAAVAAANRLLAGVVAEPAA